MRVVVVTVIPVIEFPMHYGRPTTTHIRVISLSIFEAIIHLPVYKAQLLINERL